MLFWSSVELTLFLPLRLQGNCSETCLENIHSGVQGCNLSKLHLEIYLHCFSSNETSKISQTTLHSWLSVLVKLYNIFGYKILTGFFFKDVNKLKEFSKKIGRRRIQEPVKRVGSIVFGKIKITWTKFRKNVPC